MQRLPTLYIPHGGGPCFFMKPPPAYPHLWDGLAAYLRAIDGGLGVRPKAVLVISGHWETAEPTLNVAPTPGLLPGAQQLAPLRDEGVLIVGSGMSYHNLRSIYSPDGGEAHPREEHLIPLMVAAGAAGADPGARAFGGRIMGKALSGFQFG